MWCSYVVQLIVCSMLLFATLVAVAVAACIALRVDAHEHEPIGAHLEVQARCLGGDDAVHDGDDDDVRT